MSTVRFGVGRWPTCMLIFGFVDGKKADEIIEKYIKNGESVEGVITVNYENANSIKNE